MSKLFSCPALRVKFFQFVITEAKMYSSKNQPETITLFRTTALANLELLKVSHQTHVYPRHWNETCVIQLVEQGGNEFYCRRAVHTAYAGSIVLINPYEIHTGRAIGDTPLVYRTFYPAPQLLAEVAAQIADDKTEFPFFTAPIVTDARLAAMLAQAHRACEAGTDALLSSSLIITALTYLLRHHVDLFLPALRLGQEIAAVKRAKDFLAENFTQNISLDTLSKIAYLSPFHLLRAFRQAVGLPPHEYLINVRVERGKQLLAKGRPLAEVAYETGFCDQSHFSRQFKRLVGVTPGHYLKKSNFVQNLSAC